jgi:hypothetical protein
MGRVALLGPQSEAVQSVTSPPETIAIECPPCGREYEDWWRPSLNLDLENFDDEYLGQASSATCTGCGHRVELGSLVVEGGVWHWPDLAP